MTTSSTTLTIPAAQFDAWVQDGSNYFSERSIGEASKRYGACVVASIEIVDGEVVKREPYVLVSDEKLTIEQARDLIDQLTEAVALMESNGA